MTNSNFKDLNVYVVLIQDLNNHPHRPVASISKFQKSLCLASVKISHSLPFRLRSLGNEGAQFNSALIRYINTHSFYSFDEFFMFKSNS